MPFKNNKYIITILGIFFLATFNISFDVENSRLPSSEKVSPTKKLLDRCTHLLNSFVSSNKIEVTSERFLKHYNQLNETLSGNLATVFRSEWKAKENYPKATEYMRDLLSLFAKEEGKKFIKSNKKGLSFFDDLIKHIVENDGLGNIGMRDPPPPPGSIDKTFTFYGKSINDAQRGKHQVRLRRYLRTIYLHKTKIDIPVIGHRKNHVFQITRKSRDTFEIIKAKSYNQETNTLEDIVETKKMSSYQIHKKLGRPLIFYAFPHAKKYKLEVKSRPHDKIKTENLSRLDGQNYVQKLSVNVNEDELKEIFLDLDEASDDDHFKRLDFLEQKLLENSKNSPERTKAVIDVLRYGNKKDSEFSIARGATSYRRFAFEIELPDLIDEKKVKVQTTFDIDMKAYSVYDELGNFLSPIKAVKQQKSISPNSNIEKVHIELKIPKVLVELASQGKGSPKLLALMAIFNKYRVTNKGKFNHIQLQRKIDQ